MYFLENAWCNCPCETCWQRKQFHGFMGVSSKDNKVLHFRLYIYIGRGRFTTALLTPTREVNQAKQGRASPGTLMSKFLYSSSIRIFSVLQSISRWLFPPIGFVRWEVWSAEENFQMPVGGEATIWRKPLGGLLGLRISEICSLRLLLIFSLRYVMANHGTIGEWMVTRGYRF